MKPHFLLKLKYFSIFTLLFCLCGFRTLSQSVFSIDNNKKRVTIPFSFLRNMIVVPVIINQKGPYNFILDTGVGLMIITDPKLVDSLNLKEKRLISVGGLGTGKNFEAYVTAGLKVSLPGISGENLSAAILKEDDLGLSNYAGIPIHGLLGYDFFNSFAVRISFTDTTLTVGDIRLFKRGDKIPISIEDHKPYLTTKLRTARDKEKKSNKLIVDLGAGHALSLENLANKNQDLPEKFIASNLGLSLTGPISGFLSRIEEIDIGKYKLKNVITSFPAYDTAKTELISVKRDGNLGIDILKRFNMIIDYQNGYMYLKPNVFFNTPFEHDMSGIEYYADGPDLKHIIISSVDKGSAADNIGLVKGDEILAINFKPVEKMTMEQIDALFRSKDDRSILLDIVRGKKTLKMILTLKRRI